VFTFAPALTAKFLGTDGVNVMKIGVCLTGFYRLSNYRLKKTSHILQKVLAG
jgi:hypothetical protein